MSQLHLPKLVLKEYVQKDGTAAVLLQVIIKRRKKIYSTGVSVLPSCWNKVAEKVVLPHKQKEQENQINLVLQRFKSKANAVIQRHIAFDMPLTHDSFKKEFNRVERVRDFITYFRDSIKTVNVKPSTIITYNTVLKRLSEFRSEIIFSQINYELIKDWETWVARKYNLGTNTIYKYHKTLNTFINLAINEKIPIDNPYKTYKRKRKKASRVWLDKHELNALIELYNGNRFGERIRESLRAFLFSACGGGFRISDIKQFSNENIINEDIIFEAEKTSRTKGFQRIKLTEVAKDIIKGVTGKLFKLKYGNYVNDDLKVIARMAGIKKTLTFHVARHTFAMQYLQNGGKVEELMHILNHSKIETTMVYVHMNDELVNQNMQKMNVYNKIKSGSEQKPK